MTMSNTAAVKGATARVLSTEELFPAGRTLIWTQLRDQIGFGNLAAISGLRYGLEGPSAVRLPCGGGYFVLVTLEADDTYTVRRVFKRGLKLYDHGHRSNVYADEVGEVAYFASCYVSYAPGEWEQQA